MSLPPRDLEPPFNITRASHLVLDVRDPAASRRFYTEILGFQVTDVYPDGMVPATLPSTKAVTIPLAMPKLTA